MISKDKINARIKNLAKSLGIKDTNRIRIIMILGRVVARLVSDPFLNEKLIFGGGFVLYKV